MNNNNFSNNEYPIIKKRSFIGISINGRNFYEQTVTLNYIDGEEAKKVLVDV